ncbi:hypothetical protein ABPG72_010645 [Tetrahymena utriculariae]
MKETQEIQKVSELGVRTNQQIKELHEKKLLDLAEKEYNSKNTTSILPQLEGLLLLYQRQHIIKNESDVQYAISEMQQFPIIQEYQMKDIQFSTFCQHFISQMQYTVVQLGEQIICNQLTEDFICFILKGKISIYQEKTASRIEEDFIEYLKVYYHQISLQIKEKNLQKKLNEFIKEFSSKINKKNSQTSYKINKGSSKEIIIQDNITTQQICQQDNNQITHTNIKQRRQSASYKNSKQFFHRSVNEQQSNIFNNYFNKEELRILQSVVRELIIKGIFQIIDEQGESQMNLNEQQQMLLLWYQPRTDFYFNEWGIPKFFEVQSFYSGDNFSSKKFFQDKEKQFYLILAADELHMVTMKRSQYESLSNYQPDSQKEKLKFIGEKFKDISKNTVLKFIYHFKKKEYKRKEHIWRENEKVDGIYFIQSGEVEYLKSYKTKSNLIKKQDHNIKNQKEIELIVKNDQKVQLLPISTFHQDNFIGEEDLFESQRPYSAVAKSETVIIQHLSLEDLENIKDLISEIYSQLTSKVNSKKRNLDQKLNTAIQNNEQKGDKKSILEILSNQQHSRQLKNLNEKNKRKEIQKLIEAQEQSKFTNTNDIKQIDKLIRCQFGKKKYLQMIKDNPQIILSNSTLNSLESVMSFTDIQQKTECPQKEETSKQTIQKSKQIKNISKQKNSSQNSQINFLDEQKKNEKQQDLKNQMRKSIKNVMKLNKFLFKFQIQKSSSNSENSSHIPSYNDFFSNDVDFIRDNQEISHVNNAQPKLRQVQSSNSSSQQPQLLQSQITSQMAVSTDISGPQKEKQKKITNKERKYIQQQKLQNEINSSKLQNLKNFLSNEQIQHLAAKKLMQKENYKDRNKLTIFEQQQVKKSLLEKPIRQGQNNLLTDEQKMQMKTALQSLLLNNSQKLENDFIFKGVQTQQSIKQLQLKMYQKLQHKPGMQSLCYSPNIKSKRNSLINSLALSRKQSQQLEMINQLQSSQPNSPISSNSSNNIFKSTQIQFQNPLESNQMAINYQAFSPLISSERFFEQSSVKKISDDHVNDSVIEEKKSNRQKIGCNSLSVDSSYSIYTEQLYQQNQLAVCVHRRVQSGKPKIQLNKPQSPKQLSRSLNLKYQFLSSSKNLAANKQSQNGIQIEQIRYKTQSMQGSLRKDLKYNEKNLEGTLKNESQNDQKMSMSQILDSSKNVKTDTPFRPSIRCNSSELKLNQQQKQEEISINNIAQINNQTVSNIKGDSICNKQGIEKNLQSQSNPYLNSILIDNQNLNNRENNYLQDRPKSSQIYTNLKLNTRIPLFNTQFINKLDEKSPIVIKSLQLNDFINFDKLRSNPNSRPNSAKIISKTFLTQPNLFQKNIFVPTEVSYQIASPLKQQSQITNLIQSKNNSSLSQLKSKLNLNSPLKQLNRKLSQSNTQDIQKKTNLSYQQKQNLTQNQNSPKASLEQQKILPFKRIHSATARQKLKKNTVINQIINQYKKSNGLILVPNDLLVIQESENNKTTIK